MQKQPETMLHHCCRFPTASRQNARKSQLRTIGIFEREHDRELDHLPPRDLVLNVWAALLQCYVRTDTISFLTLHNSPGHYDTGSTDSESCLGEEIETLRLHYQLSDRLSLHKMRPYKVTTVTGLEIGDVPTHTVVRFSSLHATVSCQENELHPLLTNTKGAAIVDNVSLIFHLDAAKRKRNKSESLLTKSLQAHLVSRRLS